tara:strand:- start:904 stop:1128 length:225 start_codon:yes stop_codon:yes gene_type:complete
MNNFLTKSEFSKIVEKHVLDKRMSYMDAVLHACTDHGIDPQDVKKFVSSPIQCKIEGEAMRLNLIPRGNELFFE